MSILDLGRALIQGAIQANFSKGPQTPVQGDSEDIKNGMNSVYTVQSHNWFTAKPYGFKMNTKDAGTFVCFLPISPNNLTIQTKFATNLIPTLYGTVEEHSPVRYYDITIEGTTGFAPQFVNPAKGDSPEAVMRSLQQPGRSSFSASSSFNLSFGGLFSKTLGTVNKIVNKAADTLSPPKTQTGIYTDQSGYLAFHNLYRFLLVHKKDASGTLGDDEFNLQTGTRKKHPLIFFNYKDNNEYNVVVKGFTMKRSAADPMLYYYSIQLVGYDMREIGTKVNENLRERNKNLGIDGVDSSSIFSAMKKISSTAKAIIGATSGGRNILGR